MRKTRKVIAVALVATALCADRVSAATPQGPQEGGITQVARRVVVRLTVTFRRAVPGVRIHQTLRDGESTTVSAPAAPATPAIHPVEGSPFQFRMPPPAAA